MEELPKLITDIAYILIIAGTVTIIFKQLKQPLVLGYIVAGFLAGPYMPYTPSVMDHTSIDDWSQIGVIFLMFTLGLEFSFKKIVKMAPQILLRHILIGFKQPCQMLKPLRFPAGHREFGMLGEFFVGDLGVHGGGEEKSRRNHKKAFYEMQILHVTNIYIDFSL